MDNKAYEEINKCNEKLVAIILCSNYAYELLKDIPYPQLPVEKEWAKNIYWMYGIVVDEKTAINAEEFRKKLLRNGVQTGPFFLGMHERPVFHKVGLFVNEHYPVAERIAKEGLDHSFMMAVECVEAILKGKKEKVFKISQFSLNRACCA